MDRFDSSRAWKPWRDCCSSPGLPRLCTSRCNKGGKRILLHNATFLLRNGNMIPEWPPTTTSNDNETKVIFQWKLLFTSFWKKKTLGHSISPSFLRHSSGLPLKHPSHFTLKSPLECFHWKVLAIRPWKNQKILRPVNSTMTNTLQPSTIEYAHNLGFSRPFLSKLLKTVLMFKMIYLLFVLKL